MKIYTSIQKDASRGKKKLAILIDPDKTSQSSLKKVARLAQDSGVAWFFVGGSLLTRDNQDATINWLRQNSTIPVILFPGNSMQIHPGANAILLLSLISGRNPEMLIGKHVVAAPLLKASKLEVIPTGYLLIENGRTTSVSYMSNTTPIPSHKPEIAACTAMAGEMLGLKVIYLDAGSGAKNPVPEDMIRSVKENISLPLIIGGGISDANRAAKALRAGADIIVVGNAVEKNPGLIPILSEVVSKFQ